MPPRSFSEGAAQWTTLRPFAPALGEPKFQLNFPSPVASYMRLVRTSKEAVDEEDGAAGTSKEAIDKADGAAGAAEVAHQVPPCHGGGHGCHIHGCPF